MTYAEAFDVIDVGEGRWDIQLQRSLLVVGQVWRTAQGFLLWDWADRQLGMFASLSDALQRLWEMQTTATA
jgi:hypothetical protein